MLRQALHLVFRLVLLTALALVLCAIRPTAQNFKLNGPLTRTSFEGEVLDFAVGADGRWAVFKHAFDREWSNETRLLSVPLTASGAARLLSSTLETSSNWAITPDGARAVYSGSFGVHPRGIFVVPVDGSRAPLQLAPLSGPFLLDPTGERVVFVDGNSPTTGLWVVDLDGVSAPRHLTAQDTDRERVSPTGERVVYLARGIGGQQDLYSVPTAADAPPVRLNGVLVVGGNVREFAITGDGARVVYRADQDVNDCFELFSAPIDGSAPAQKLHSSLASRLRVVSDFRVDPSGARVVYLGEQDTDNVFELYSVPSDASQAPVKLSAPLPAGGDVGAFEIDPTGRRVVYLADQLADDVIELFQVGIGGAFGPVRVNAPLVAEGDVRQFWIDPRGRRVAYRADQDTDGVIGLYAASLAHGGSVALASPVDPFVQFSPDGRRVVFGRAPDLFSVPADGSQAPVPLHGPLAGEVREPFAITPDSTAVLFLADADVAGRVELFRAPIAGGAAPERLNGTVTGEHILGRIGGAKVSADGRRVLYNEQVQSSGDSTHDAVFSREIAPRTRPVRLFPFPVHDDDAVLVGLTPDGQRSLFLVGSEEGESTARLFSAASDGSLPTVLLNDPTGCNYGVQWTALAPDGTTLFYSQDGSGRGLYRVSVDGGTPPLELTGVGPGDDAFSFRLAPDGSRLVYLSPLTYPSSELASVAADGSAPPLSLNDVAAPLGSQYQLELTLDGARVVYRTDQDADEVFELYSVASDGSSPPVKLSGTLVAGGDVERFVLSPDGSVAVFVADRLQDGEGELFRVPVDGSAPPVPLNDLPGPGRILWELAVSPDGTRVVYRTDQGAPGVAALYSVPLDGSSAPVELNGPLVAGGDVGTSQLFLPAFRITPDGQRVVYAADQRADEVFEVFVTPIDGSRPPVVLSGPFVAGSSTVGTLALTPDGAEALYVADQESDGVFELFAVPLDASSRARRLNGPLVEGGDVTPSSFQVTNDGRAVLYFADQDVDGATELYASFLARTPRAPVAVERP